MTRKNTNNKNIKKGKRGIKGNTTDDIVEVAIVAKQSKAVNLPWSDEKRDLLKELWSKYKIGELCKEEMEEIFCCSIYTICAYAKHLNLKVDFRDNKINYDKLIAMGIKTKSV